MKSIDLLCVGYACYDLIFAVDHQPGPNEKSSAKALISCGGGTAANAAVTAAKLGCSVAFASYLGDDIYGTEHLHELEAAGVDTELIVRGAVPTSLSAIFVKPDGARSIVNYRGAASSLTAADVGFDGYAPRVILFDGHHPRLAIAVADWAGQQGISTVIDADTINEGNVELVKRCEHVVASERFACEYNRVATPEEGLMRLAELSPNVVVTMGERGLIWQRGDEQGQLDAFEVDAIDTTGAGDTFHGAYAAGVAAGMAWEELLRYASAAAALCCTVHGARLGIPTRDEVMALLAMAA